MYSALLVKYKCMVKLIFSAFILGFIYVTSAFADEKGFASHSLLSSGRWVKVKVEKTGVYRLTSSDLKKMGFSDPSKISVHGYGGWILDEDFSSGTYLDDIPAVPVWRYGDDVFFYAKGPVKWKYTASKNYFEHTNNPYSDAGYYFITDATDVESMEELSSVDGAVRQISVFDDYQVWEKDEVAINESGRQLFGEAFISTTSRNFSFDVPNITSDDAKVTIRFVSTQLHHSNS